MDVQLRDEAAQDRVRAATEFIDPGKFAIVVVNGSWLTWLFFLQAMHGHAGSSI